MEKAKIGCAKRLFEQFRNENGGVCYDQVTSYQDLLDIVNGEDCESGERGITR